METIVRSILLLVMSVLTAWCGDVSIDTGALGAELGGWRKRGKQAAEYELSGVEYRTYKPEVTLTPQGGIFVSVRIDHIRGIFSSDDHAMLEVTLDKEGKVESAQSSIAIQGRSVTSDLIRATGAATGKIAGVDRAVKIGSDLVADVTAKLLREKIVEPGRVSYPSVLRHNYNLLHKCIRVKTVPKAEIVDKTLVVEPPKEEEKLPDEKLQFHLYGGKPKVPIKK